MVIVYHLVMDVVGRSRFWSNSPSWVWTLKYHAVLELTNTQLGHQSQVCFRTVRPVFFCPKRATSCGLFAATVRHRNKDLRKKRILCVQKTLIKRKLEIAVSLTFLIDIHHNGMFHPEAVRLSGSYTTCVLI